MDEYHTDALQYGQLGTAEYIAETCSWRFPRAIGRVPCFSYTGVARETLPPSVDATPVPSVDRSQVASLSEAHPHLAAISSLDREETLSRTITTAANGCDPGVSNVFSLGHAVDLENDSSGTRAVPIAVAVTGRCGDSISLFRIEDEVAEWRQERLYKARVPSVGTAESTTWMGCGVPIRQICFAQTAEVKATWMAARLPTSTTIFRPLYHRTPVAISGESYCDPENLPSLRNSRLNANPLVDIHCYRTGGYPHAYVTFNPWYQKQLAIVDIHGNWSIWNISGRNKRARSNWLADCVKSGTLPSVDPSLNGFREEQPRYDGWAAVQWVADVNHLIVCDRRCIFLYQIAHASGFARPIDLGLRRETEWILDLKRSPSRPSIVFILTTSRIFWLDITSSDALFSGEEDTPLTPQLSWRHYRDTEDITLQLTITRIGNDLCLMLYSRLNNLVQAFRLSLSTEEAGRLSFMPDPSIMQIPDLPHAVSSESESHDMCTRIATMVFKEIEHGPPPGQKELYEPDLRLLKLFMLDSRSALHEALYTGSTDNENVDSTDYTQELSTAGDILRLRKRAIGTRPSRATADVDVHFVVDDMDESVSRMAIQPPGLNTPSALASAAPQWTVDYSSVYAAISRKQAPVGRFNDDLLPERNFGECLADLYHRISSSPFSESITAETLFEVAQCLPFLDDIDENAKEFQDFKMAIFQAVDGPNRPRFLPASLSSLTVEDNEGKKEASLTLGVVEIYNDLVRKWLFKLPSRIPGRTRVAKERIIRGVAGELSLARVNLLRNVEALTVDNDATSSPGRGEYPFRTDISAEPQGPRTIQSSPPLPSNYGPDRLKSTSTANARQMSHQMPLFAGLSSLTTFEESRTPPKNVAEMLSHWSVGSDPATYDWQRTVQQLENDDLRVREKSTTPRRRSRKRAPQSLSQNTVTTIPVLPTVPVVRQWGSQPQDVPPAVQSSQAVDEHLPMTQVERGLFGGREAAPRKSIGKARKKRAAGF
ncbi:hypothetical protein ACLA_026600 [Paecilomyces variotii No. 5]|uniref:RNA polymerase I-specific transcription initiation factor RRN6-like protein n=1 Tax=Byssochlamys spectabilis (strain No. 5 / NBRC 109023) TaxID=1356009 RepID=V5G0T5_BYSSN|nr:hypothetical protein ACLA_026600 [Paecilomyces variotii No. 5]